MRLVNSFCLGSVSVNRSDIADDVFLTRFTFTFLKSLLFSLRNGTKPKEHDALWVWSLVFSYDR